MKTAQKPDASGKAMASLASFIGLALVWSIVWANLPSWEELLSERPVIPAVPVVPELDLSIPGVPAKPLPVPSRQAEPAVPATSGTVPTFREIKARQIAEMKCDAEGQRLCPDSLTGEALQQCMVQRMKQLSRPCQRIVRQQMAR